MKLSKLIPVLKPGECDKVVNHRPMRMLPLLSKVFEKLIFDSLAKLLGKHYILTGRQFGFKSKINTSDAITIFLDNAYHFFRKYKHKGQLYLLTS